MGLCDSLTDDLASGSAGSNTTKTASDNSSRHSAASTVASSTDYPPPAPQKDDWKMPARNSVAFEDVPAPLKPSNGFLRQSGRTFSFGNRKGSGSLPSIPAEESVPSMPEPYSNDLATSGNHSRTPTTSSVNTATPSFADDRDNKLKLGYDVGVMISKFDQRSSVAIQKDRNLTANRSSQLSPLKVDRSAAVEPPQHSWNSQTSTDGLLGPARVQSPTDNRDTRSAHDSRDVRPAAAPPVPTHNTSPSDNRLSEEDEEDATLLADTLAATQFLNSSEDAGDNVAGEYRRNDKRSSHTRTSLTETYANDENMFASPDRRERSAPRMGLHSIAEPQTKVMTPKQFEQYRKDKVKREIMDGIHKDGSDSEGDGINYDDEEEDDQEKSRQVAKQRRKQEAHMAVYRQQMMKVTGEAKASPNDPSAQPTLTVSLSTPNLTLNDGFEKSRSVSPPSEASSDEEVPLAILQAHGFPNRNRPPTRLDGGPSNPNLRAAAAAAAAAQPPHIAGPGSVHGGGGAMNDGSGGRLPPFARRLPRDPYLGAGLINQPPRESFALGGGAPASMQNPSVPTGGLIGVIANEERAKAMRRGSPSPLPHSMPMNGGFDPVTGIPHQMMYPTNMQQMQGPMLSPGGPMLSPGGPAQYQMTQQMNQFMQMQMQLMQMMAGQGGQGQAQGHMPGQSIGSMADLGRTSFLGDPLSNGIGGGLGRDLRGGDSQMRTMSMVQPSSASWIQPPQSSYTPSIRLQGGYTPSIAPSERSNIGLPGRYRPVSSAGPITQASRTSTMSGAIPTMSKLNSEIRATPISKDDDDDDDEQGWEAMKAKRERKQNMWRSKKNFGSDIGALIS